MRNLLTIICGICFQTGFTQPVLHGVVADSLSGKVLPFATIRDGKDGHAIIAGIDGHFILPPYPDVKEIAISYVGYTTKILAVGYFKKADTVFLRQSQLALEEVTVVPQTEKIRRILNNAIRKKPEHNPEFYPRYQCYIYYKMYADLLPGSLIKIDSMQEKGGPVLPAGREAKTGISKSDSGFFRDFLDKNHLIFSETYSRRNYRKPMQLQDEVIAARFSGLKKTYFTSLVTDVLPFHVYGDFITLNGTDYINPVARGWGGRYEFRLADEITDGLDTVFILTFRPKKHAVFNSLRGVVYINSDGYAISHFLSSTGDSTDDREARIEQNYSKIDGRWFPQELNYTITLKKYPSPSMGITMKGHSLITGVSFDPPALRFNKAHPVILLDSVDLHTPEAWERIRPDSLSAKEKSTYRVLDSLSKKVNLENKVSATGKLAVGRLGIGSVDLLLNRVVAYNEYEGIRLGIGLYTNDRVSKYYSLGGWSGYGFADGRWKFGISGTIFPMGEKDNWLRFSYQDNYQSAGDIHIHPDIDQEGFRNWLLAEVDRIKEYAFTAHTQRGYWEIELEGLNQTLESRYKNDFEEAGKNPQSFQSMEADLGLKYAYGEKRIPLFGYYIPMTTQFPVLYFRMGAGEISSGNYKSSYYRVLAAILYTRHFNRWGKDRFQLETGFIGSINNQPLPPALLLAGKGFKNDEFNYYAWGGFLTMRPYDYFSDRYISLFYKHDFDKSLWDLKYSKPYLSLAYNFLYGGLTAQNKNANPETSSPTAGFHETGLLFNQLLTLNYLHLANLNLNTGPFYHWDGPLNLNKNARWVFGLSVVF